MDIHNLDGGYGNNDDESRNGDGSDGDDSSLCDVDSVTYDLEESKQYAEQQQRKIDQIRRSLQNRDILSRFLPDRNKVWGVDIYEHEYYFVLCIGETQHSTTLNIKLVPEGIDRESLLPIAIQFLRLVSTIPEISDNVRELNIEMGGGMFADDICHGVAERKSEMFEIIRQTFPNIRNLNVYDCGQKDYFKFIIPMITSDLPIDQMEIYSCNRNVIVLESDTQCFKLSAGLFREENTSSNNNGTDDGGDGKIQPSCGQKLNLTAVTHFFGGKLDNVTKLAMKDPLNDDNIPIVNVTKLAMEDPLNDENIPIVKELIKKCKNLHTLKFCLNLRVPNLNITPEMSFIYGLDDCRIRNVIILPISFSTGVDLEGVYTQLFAALGVCNRGRLINIEIEHWTSDDGEASSLTDAISSSSAINLAFKEMLLNNWCLERCVWTIQYEGSVASIVKDELQPLRRFQSLKSVGCSESHPSILQLWIDRLISSVGVYRKMNKDKTLIQLGPGPNDVIHQRTINNSMRLAQFDSMYELIRENMDILLQIVTKRKTTQPQSPSQRLLAKRQLWLERLMSAARRYQVNDIYILIRQRHKMVATIIPKYPTLVTAKLSTYNVFTSQSTRRLTGNQMFVVTDCDILSVEEMQTFADELDYGRDRAYSLWCFILKPSPDWHVRYRVFSSLAANAGHQTLGAAYHAMQHLLPEGTTSISLDCGGGIIPVQKGESGWGESPCLWMDIPTPKFESEVNAADFCFQFDWDSDRMGKPDACRVYTIYGLSYFIVRVPNPEVLSQLNPPGPKSLGYCAKFGISGIYIIAEGNRDNSHTYLARCYLIDGKSRTVREDPATGLGCGCFAAWALDATWSEDKKVEFCVGQGYEMGRPSLVAVKAERIKRIKTGGDGEKYDNIKIQIGGYVTPLDGPTERTFHRYLRE